MFIVKTQEGQVVLIASRKEDADAFLNTELDATTYLIEEVKPKEELIYPGGCAQ